MMTGRGLRRIIAVGAMTAVLAVLATSVVHADPESDVDYETEEPTPGDDGDGAAGDDDGAGDGGSSEPPCDTTAEFDVCFGDVACWVRDPALSQNHPDLEESRPSEDAEVAYRQCEDGSFEWYWNTEEEDGPSLEERIRRARGALAIPAFEASFNPPGRTLVNLPTWWWAEGIPAGEIRGSEALGLVGIATRRHMVVDPGDGSGSFTCEFSTSRSDGCAHTYRRASVGGTERSADGSRAYGASVTVVYDLRFEDDGEVVDIPDGLPRDLLTLQRSSDVAVSVQEVQSLVTDIG